MMRHSLVQVLVACVLSAARVGAGPYLVGQVHGLAPESTTAPAARALSRLSQQFQKGASFAHFAVQLDATGEAILWPEVDFAPWGEPGLMPADPVGNQRKFFGEQGKRLVLPSLEEALKLADTQSSGRLVASVELKIFDFQLRKELVREVARVLRRLDLEYRVLVSSSDLRALRFMEQLIRGVETAYIAYDPASGWARLDSYLEDSKEPRIEWLLVQNAFAGTAMSPEELVRFSREKGVLAGVFSVNKRYQWMRFARAGFQMLITEEPRLP